MVVACHAAIVFKGFGARGLDIDARERKVTDLQQLTRGEEGHVGRIMKQGIHQTAFLENQQLEISPQRFNPASQAGRPGAHHKHVKQVVHQNRVLPRPATGAAVRS